MTLILPSAYEAVGRKLIDFSIFRLVKVIFKLKNNSELSADSKLIILNRFRIYGTCC